MNLRFSASSRRCACSLVLFAGAALAPEFIAAQGKPVDAISAETKSAELTKTIFLTHATDRHGLTDIATDLRAMLPRAHVYPDLSANAISMQGTADDLALGQQIVGELDRPHMIYRLTYTITASENGKQSSTQRVSFIVLPGEKTVLRQGSRVPIVTGITNAEKGGPNSQVQYLDVGLNIDARLEGSPDDLRLSTKVEQSSLSEERSGIGSQDPVIRQTQLQGDVLLTQNKSLSIGSLDIPGGTRHQEVAVVAELVR